MTRYYNDTHEHYTTVRPGHQDYYDYDPLPTRAPTLDEIAAHEAANAYADAIEAEVLSVEWVNRLAARSAALMVSDPALGRHVGATVQALRDWYRAQIVAEVEDWAALDVLGVMAVRA